jgi:hypothetical protein
MERIAIVELRRWAEVGDLDAGLVYFRCRREFANRRAMKTARRLRAFMSVPVLPPIPRSSSAAVWTASSRPPSLALV